MRLGWSRFHIILNLLVDSQSGIDQRAVHIRYFAGELSCTEEPFENGAEDGLHGIVIEKSEGNNVQVPLHAWSDL